MEEQEMAWIASKYHQKGYNTEDLRYGDDLYGKEQYFDQVMEYYTEYEDIGRIAFYEKYKHFKLY